MQPNDSAGRSAVSSGVLTGLSTAAVSGSAAVAGAILSRKFGHGVKTDGFIAAYAVYLALVLVAQALRVVVLPAFARAVPRGRLGAEVSGWAVAIGVPSAALAAVAIVAPHWSAGVIDGNAAGRVYAAQLLPWLIPAAAAQILAALGASALAAVDDYGTAAVAFSVGAVAGLAVTIALLDHGVVAFGVGLAVNGALAAGIPMVQLARKRLLVWPERGGFARRARDLAEGVALPFALQGFFVVANRFAGGLGEGEQTTFGYAYLIAAFLVAVTASSIALVSSAPLSRGELTADRAARHIGAAAWVSLAIVAAAAGVFALAGSGVTHRVLGSAYGGTTGTELGQLVVWLAPWMVASVGVSVTFPLLFVRGRTRLLPWIAVGAIVAHVGFESAGRHISGLSGIATGMALSTFIVLVSLCVLLGVLIPVGRGIVTASLVCGAIGAACFGVPGVLLNAVVAAAVGLVAYGLVVWRLRPTGLVRAWAYLRNELT